MKITLFRTCAFAALSFAAGSLLTRQFTVHAQDSKVFELRAYHTAAGRLPALEAHHLTSIGYWVPQDSPQKDNTLIYIISHPSREAAKKNWMEFVADPEWQQVAKASEADGKIVEKIDSTYMDPTDFSQIK
jgi:hypothetical protein